MSKENDDEFDEVWDLRNVDLYGREFWEGTSVRMDELIEKAKKDPFWFPKKKTKKESKKDKKFRGYNWTTHKKKIKGLKKKIAELKATSKRSKKEEITLKRMISLLKWHNWALRLHKEGKSDKWIHEETERKKEDKKRKAKKK